MDDVEVPEEWVREAAAAEKLLYEAPDDKTRKKVLRAKRGLWAKLAPALAKVSNNKCWYCEVRQRRSDMPVDHYRPKGSVSDAKAYEGYWWLAFRPNNFRFSCTYCNSRRVDVQGGTAGGKQDHFPLVEESRRALTPCDRLGLEQPLLLDPIVAADPSLLYFDLEGRAVPNPRLCPEQSVECKRASGSVELLHLNHAGIKEQRKQLNRKLLRDFMRAVENLDGHKANHSEASAAFKAAVDELRRAIAEQSELSASARAFLKGRRGDGSEAEEVLEYLGL
jgi:hypothetical protein